MNFVRHLRMLGPAGLAALIGGGSVLIFVALNTPWTTRGDKNAEAFQFQHGSELSIQGWLAILGVGFGCISYGLNEAYVHFFDAWCSRLARREEGLNYGRYLNCQARAPVVYGMRGFPVLVTTRYALSIIAVATSVGYKFGIAQFKSARLEVSNSTCITFSQHSVHMVNNKTISPWLSDSLANENVRGFTYLPFDDDAPYYDDLEVRWRGEEFSPGWQKGNSKTDIAMVAVADCSLPADTKIITWELAMMAIVKEDEDTFKMEANHTGWTRTEASHRSWQAADNFTASRQTIVDYRVNDRKVQIQWALAGPWTKETSRDSSKSEPVPRRLTYSFTKILANVTRIATAEGCFVSQLEFAKIVQDQPKVKDDNDTIDHLKPWVAAFVSDENTSRAEGIAAIVRMLMTRWFGETKLGLVLEDDNPLREENKGISFPPVQVTRIVIYIGCYTVASRIFLIIGIGAFLVVQVRVTIGPAPLTSWMGQHVYLALNGYTSTLGREDLLRGQDAASDEFARLMLSAHVTHPSDWRRVYDEVGDAVDSEPAKVPLRRDV
ncbi:hypothetical protein CDV31_014240 [Fusarium ambrosium]|uniref:Uncharacterized protein n=1 Tax=Fusarium ambrosium TaxID=131363 RepID=A0A428SY48_9HYPO|nr:hypothetical protein CDV31_014240 [Fusarium ambrosium]